MCPDPTWNTSIFLIESQSRLQYYKWMEICYSLHNLVDTGRRVTFYCDEWNWRDSKRLENDCNGISLEKWECLAFNSSTFLLNYLFCFRSSTADPFPRWHRNSHFRRVQIDLKILHLWVWAVHEWHRPQWVWKPSSHGFVWAALLDPSLWKQKVGWEICVMIAGCKSK